jgi:hypothetical protein
MKKGFFLIFFLVSFLLSCEKEDEFKIPVDVDFYMDIQRGAALEDKLHFTEGFIRLSSFRFRGQREQADEVRFEKAYEQGLTLPFSPVRAVPELKFQVPQGNYNRISIVLETYNDLEDAAEVGLELKGTFAAKDGKRYPLLFQLESAEVFRIAASSNLADNQIILKKEAPAVAYIRLHPGYWFQGVSAPLLEGAALVPVNGVPTILINESYNETIYDILVDRLGEDEETVFAN